jgi:hypothetical protein
MTRSPILQLRRQRGGVTGTAARALIALVTIAAAAPAQSGGRGFLFAAPTGSFTLRGGYALATAASDFFDFTTDELTLNRRDFSSPAFDAELAARFAPRTEFVLWLSYAGVRRPSEYRHFIDNNDQPIEQETDFRRVPITAGIRQYLVSPGRSVGTLAWIPSRAAPYVSAGGGLMWYRFRQSGDFVEKPSLDVFRSTFESGGWTWAAHAALGLDYSLGTHLALTGETRYLLSKAQLSGDFFGYAPLDLSGLSTMAGFMVRF